MAGTGAEIAQNKRGPSIPGRAKPPTGKPTLSGVVASVAAAMWLAGSIVPERNRAGRPRFSVVPQTLRGVSAVAETLDARRRLTVRGHGMIHLVELA